MHASVQDDDSIGLNMNTGNRGIEAIVKAYEDGTDEVKDLLKYECEMIFECRYCRNLYRSIPNFLSHKRQNCKTLCRTVAPNTLISKHLEDFSSLFVNNKGTPPTSVKKNAPKSSRHNIVAAFQKRLHTTTISDDMNRVDLYSLPSISRYQPQTTFKDGQQVIVRHNPLMAIKEHEPDDNVLLIMPNNSNVSQKCGDMLLRRRKAIDVEEKEMTGKELIVLDYIPTDIRKHINPATCQCLYEICEANTKPFENLLALAYHLTVTHNRPLNAKEVLRLRKGREGQYLCFLCGTTHGGTDKVKTHIQKEHSDIRELHLQQRRQLFDTQNSKSRRKLDPAIYFEKIRHRSISPSESEIGHETIEESAELPVTESMEKQSNDSSLSSNADSQSTSATTLAAIKNGVASAAAAAKKKFPINKKKKRPRLTMKRKKPQISSSSKVQKDSPTEEQPPKLEKQIVVNDEDVEMEEEEEDEKEPESEELEEEETTTPESQIIPELISQTDSMSPPLPSQTRSPSNESEKKKGLVATRSKRTRVPKKFFEFVPNNLKKGQRGSKEPPKKKSRPSEQELITPKQEIVDSDMPILQKEPIKSTTKKAPMLSLKQSKRNARSSTASPVKASASSTPSKSSASKIREVFKSEFDAEGWVTPDSSFAEGLEPATASSQSPKAISKKKLPYTPKAAAAAREGGGSSRRKQRLNISDDHEGNIPKRLESEEKEERTSIKPVDLSTLPIIMTPEDEELFYKPLKPLFKMGTDGNHQCSECGQTFLSQKEGRRHMLTHIRAVRFRCALCDVGAFYCEDMRSHLMNRNCPSLHLVPDKYQGTAIPCMTVKESDELTQIVHQEFPGQFRFTSGKIVTSDNPAPHRPDAKIEESILGPMNHIPYISPIKERPKILSRSNKSPSRLVPVSDSTTVSTPTKSTTTQNETRIVTPLKLVRNKNSEAYDTIASSSTSSKLKLPGFKLLKPASPTNSETLETAPNVEDASESSNQPSTSAPLTIQEPPSAIPPSPPAADEEIVEPEHEHPPQEPSPPPEHQEPEEPNDDTEPLDPIQPAGPHLIGRRSIDPVDPS